MDAKISSYENILKESVDTIQLVRDELKLDQVEAENMKRQITI